MKIIIQSVLVSGLSLLILWEMFSIQGCFRGVPEEEIFNLGGMGPSFDAYGLWKGKLKLNENQDTTRYLNTLALISTTGESFFLYSDTNNTFYPLISYGFLKQNEIEIFGTMTVFDTPGPPIGTLNISDGKMTEVHPGYRMMAQCIGSTPPLNGRGTLNLTRVDSNYSIPPSYSKITGHWESQEANDTIFFDIQENGKFTGGNSSGGEFNGNILINWTDKNFYFINSFEITGCGNQWNGTYHGFATIIDHHLNWVVVNQDESFGIYLKLEHYGK